MVFDFRHRGEAETCHTGQLADLDFVHFVVAAQQKQDNVRRQCLAGLIDLVACQDQRFDGCGQGQTEHLGDRRAGAFARRRQTLHRLGRRGSGVSWWGGLRLFHIGRIVAAGCVNNGIFARCGNHLELFAQVTAYGAAVSGHRAVAQAETVKNLAIGLRHGLVTHFGSIGVAVKAVGILHGELAPAHQAEAGTAFVAELGLDLVEVLGQLFVAFDLLAHDVGHHLFAGRLHHVIARVPVFDAHQFGAHFLEAPGFLPQLGGLDHRHGDLDRPGSVHLFAHDRLHLADHAQAHRHVAVNTGTELFDHTGAHHQLMAGNFGVGRCFFEGGNEELGGFHRVAFAALGARAAGKMRPCIMVQV